MNISYNLTNYEHNNKLNEMEIIHNYCNDFITKFDNLFMFSFILILLEIISYKLNQEYKTNFTKILYENVYAIT